MTFLPCPTLFSRRLSLGLALGLSLALCPLSARAVQPLRVFLEASTAHAYDNRAASATVAQREAEHDEAVYRLLPTVVATAGYTRNQYEITATLPAGVNTFRTVTITPQDQLDATVGVTVPLVDVPAIERIRSRTSTRDAAQWTARATRDQVARSVVRAYYQYAAAEAVVRASRDALAVAVQHRDIVRTRVEAGLSSDLENRRAESEVARDAQTVSESDLSRRSAARQLRTLTGIEPTDDASLSAAALIDALGTTGDLAPEAPLATWLSSVEGLSAVRAARAAQGAAGAARAGAWTAYAPTVSATAQERFTNAVGFGTSPLWSVGVSARWQLDLASSATARAQAAAEETAAVQLAQSIQNARDEIEDAWLQVASVQVRAAASRAEESSARRNAEIVQARYTAGTATLVDSLQAARDLFAAQVARVQADTALGQSRALLRLAAGRTSEVAP